MSAKWSRNQKIALWGVVAPTAVAVLTIAVSHFGNPSGTLALHILYSNAELNGHTIEATIRAVDPNQATLFALQPFQAENSGESVNQISAHLYFSVPIDAMTASWTSIASDDSKFVSAFLWTTPVTAAPISHGETTSLPEFQGNKVLGFTAPISARLKIFYGADKPAEANFTVTPQAPAPVQ
jgi:hypothetical protein